MLARRDHGVSPPGGVPSSGGEATNTTHPSGSVELGENVVVVKNTVENPSRSVGRGKRSSCFGRSGGQGDEAGFDEKKKLEKLDSDIRVAREEAQKDIDQYTREIDLRRQRGVHTDVPTFEY